MYQRTKLAYSRSASAMSAALSVAGVAGDWFSTMPSGAFTPAARMDCSARPCDSSRWCDTWAVSCRSWRPGANWPLPWPRKAVHQGSLWVAMLATRSPRRRPITCAYSAKR